MPNSTKRGSDVIAERRYGFPARRFSDAAELMQRFAVPIPESGCWIWIGHTSSGYGRVHHAGRQQYAHRVAYELTHGRIPDGMCVCHRCDIRECVNPAHMFLGTKADNRADCVWKGRQAKGSTSGPSLLREKAVEAVLARDLSITETAEALGTSYANAWSIKRGRSWKHINRGRN